MKSQYWKTLLLLGFTCIPLYFYKPCFAQRDLAGLESEADIGLAAESTPLSKDFEIPQLTLKAATGKPIIDGHINDIFWEQAETFELNFELYPERLAPASVKTEALLAATKTHLYLAFIANDPNSENLRSALREYDASKEDDYVSVIIDPTGSMAKKYEFRVNPHGTLSDVLQDTISDRYIYDWDTEWEAAAQINDKGYTVELAIPANSIRVPSHDTSKDSRGSVILKRSYPRSVDQVFATFFTYKKTTSETDKGAEILSETDSQDSEKKGFKGIPDKLKLKLHYIYHLDEERDIGKEFEQAKDRDEHSVGLDAVYNLSTSRAFAFTIYPNFTEVEVDIAQQSINNPFTIFQPEKRAFFKGATEYFRSLLPVVYTRNIIQPEVGFAFINDDSINSFGAFINNDKETEVIVPDNLGSDKVTLLEKSYAGAFRFRRTRNKRTGGIIGSYRGADGYHNATVGFDGLFDFGPDDKLRFHFLYSNAKYPKRFAEDLCEEDGCTDEPLPEECPLGDCSLNAQVLRTDYTRELNGHGLKVRYKHDGPSGLYWLSYEQSSPDFRADLGFYRRIDIRSLDIAYGKKWYFKTLRRDKGKSRIRTYVIGNYIRSYEYDDLLEKSVSFWGEFRGTFQSVMRLGWRLRERAVNRINQASLETGDNAPLFDENYIQWFFETAPWGNWKINLDGRYGKIADAENMVLGNMVEIEPIITYRYGPVEFKASGTFRDFEYEDKSLYKERFLSFIVLYRKSKRLNHRLIYLDNLTKRDIDRWRGDELPKEIERIFEYTLTYTPNKEWSILAGVKLEYEFESDIDDGDITNRQLYCKIEKKF